MKKEKIQTEDYRISEIEKAEVKHNHLFKFKMVIHGTGAKSKFISISSEELRHIKIVLKRGDNKNNK